MSKTVRIGLVGIGEIAHVHAKGYAGLENVELVAVCGTRPENARQFAAEFGTALSDSYAALLADPSVAAVDICVPNHLHPEYALQAVRAGKHVLCEKPIALKLEDGKAMVEEARRAGVHLIAAHVWRFWPEVQITRAAIQSGRLGRPLLVSGRRMISLLAGTQGAQGWRHDPARSGGAVIDMQIHDIDFFCWLFGRPASVVARGLRSPDGGINHVLTLLEFPGVQRAFVEASFMMPGNPLDISFHVLGDEASIEYAYKPESMLLHGLSSRASGEVEPSLILYRAGQDPEPLYTPREDSFVVAMRDQLHFFAECVQLDRPPDLATGRDALLALEVALASRTSIEQGIVVKL
jgi:UDP-N-acetylglucosamine 3-dehydrogenase